MKFNVRNRFLTFMTVLVVFPWHLRCGAENNHQKILDTKISDLGILPNTSFRLGAFVASMNEASAVKVVVCDTEQEMQIRDAQWTLRDFLGNLQLRWGIQVLFWDDFLCLACPRIPPVQASSAAVGGPSFDSAAEKIAASLTSEQISLIQSGKRIALKTLGNLQRTYVKEFLEEMNLKGDTQAIFDNGDLFVTIPRLAPIVYLNGIPLDSESLGNQEFNQLIESSQKLEEESTYARQKEVLGSLLQDRSISFDKVTFLTATEVCERLSGMSQRKIVPSKLISEKRIIFGKGDYTATEFGALAACAVGGVFRHVGEVLHFAPRLLNVITKEEMQYMREADAYWSAMEPLMKALGKSPASSFIPFDSSSVINLRLVPYGVLSAEQRSYVLDMNSLKEIDLQKLQRDRIECLAAPMVTCRLTYIDDSGEKKRIGRGFTPRLYYAWVKTRSAHNQSENKNGSSAEFVGELWFR